MPKLPSTTGPGPREPDPAAKIPPVIAKAGKTAALKDDPIRVTPPKMVELDPGDQLKLERLYERRANALAKITITIRDPDDLEPAPPSDILIEDKGLAASILAHQKKGGAIRLSLSLPLRPTVKGNPNTMCPCDLEP